MSDRVLFIGGMDSSGGAGILRDAATAGELGARCCAAVTAVTVQSDRAVTAIHPIPPNEVAAQIHAAAERGIGAVKIGMLCSAATVEAVAAALPDVPVVLDPVLASSSGHALLDREGIRAMLALLLRRTTLLTPNIPELRSLTAHLDLCGKDHERTHVAALVDQGCPAVLVKGGHSENATSSEDRLYLGHDRVIAYPGSRFQAELRGSGCQLASAVAVHLARGNGLPVATELSKDLVRQRFVEVVGLP
jgi:hydroxymethylpyrimidine/phosphomethylpyrimidine kinase